jgi:hypothetical protein
MQTIFDQLEKQNGGADATAKALDLPLRTYMDWKHRGFWTMGSAKRAAFVIEHKTGIKVNPAELIKEKPISQNESDQESFPAL